MDFYDDIADSYGQLTGASDRQGPAGRFARELTRRFDIASAVDAACGTGLFAIELARCGVEVVGSDISPGMLKSAPSNAASATVDANLCSWVQAPMQELSQRISGARDAVVCMGNSTPHLLTDDDLNRTFAGFATLLTPRGVLAIHLLNYSRVLSQGERIVGVNRSGSKEFVRFYDFDNDFLDFNILEIHWDDEGRSSHKLHSTRLRAYLHTELTDALAAAGFGTIETYGDLQFNPFNPETSDTLLLIATR
jgi:glycine/sarcosine N-methyltransferase